MKMKTLIHSGRVIDPANRIDSRLNLLIENGKDRVRHARNAGRGR